MATNEEAAEAARPAAHWLLLMSLVALWGSSPAVNKVALEGLPPSVIVGLRMAIAAVLLLGLSAVRGVRLPLGRDHLVFYVLAGIFGSALPFFLITWGQQAVPSGLTAVFFAIMPLSTLLLAHFWLAGERLSARRTTGFSIGFLGILVLVGRDALAELAGAQGLLIFELSIMAGAFCYAINAIVARLRPEGDLIAMAGGATLLSALLTLPPALILHPPASLGLTPSGTIAVLSLGLFSTALPTVLFLQLVTLAGASFASMVNYLIPVWGLMVGMTVMGEALQPRAVAALLLILGGIMLAERRPVRKIE